MAISTLVVQPGRSGSNESYLVSLLQGLARVSDNVRYILFVSAANQTLFQGLGDRFRLVKVPGAAAGRPLRIVLDQLVIGFWAQRLHADVLHFPGTVGSALRLRIPQVVTVHYDLEPAHLPSIGPAKLAYVKHLMRRTCRIARCLVVPSAAFADGFVRRWRVPPDRVTVVYHGVQAGEKGTTMPRDLPPGFLLCVTNDLPHKNVRRLIEAYRILWDRGVRQPLVLAGNIAPAVLREWLNLVSASADTERSVLLTGFLPHREVLALYGTAGVMVTPTLAESSSMPVLEAMAHGCPVVASDIPVHREIAGAAARLVDPADATAIADAVQQLLEDPDERRRLVAAGAAVASRFSWQRTAADMLAVYARAAA